MTTTVGQKQTDGAQPTLIDIDPRGACSPGGLRLSGLVDHHSLNDVSRGDLPTQPLVLGLELGESGLEEMLVSR
jgi:hypothetical protein